MKDTRQELLRMLAERSFQLGQFTLSSGASSDYYVDCRSTTLRADGARLRIHCREPQVPLAALIRTFLETPLCSS